MSERLKSHGEQNEVQGGVNREQQEAIRQNIEKKAEQATHEHAEKLDDIRSKIETEAADKQEHSARKKQEKESKEKDQPTYVNKELKDLAYQRTLRRTQKKLPAPARVLSKVIHQPAIEAASEIAGKTVARPSGILTGGIIAFLGGSVFLWAARHYGFEYNFLLFAILFVGGYFLGLLIEFGVYALSRNKSR